MFYFAQTTDISNSYFDFKISWHTDTQRDQEKIIDQHDKIWKGTKNCFGNKVAHQWCVAGVKKKNNNTTENGKNKNSAILFFELDFILVNIG